jgi:hypothetical protein
MSPSVKIRRRAYSTIAEPRNHGELEPRPLTSIFRPPDEISSTPEAGNAVQLQGSPTISGRVPSPLTHTRPLSTSKVHNHCMRQSQSMRLLQAPSSDRRSRTSYAESRRTASPTHLVPHDGMVIMEGPQADVQVHSDGEPGLIGSALSLPHSQNLGGMRMEDDDEHHHDDIVEHLDVIGTHSISTKHLSV